MHREQNTTVMLSTKWDIYRRHLLQGSVLIAEEGAESVVPDVVGTYEETASSGHGRAAACMKS